MSDKSWEPEHFLTHSLTLSLFHSLIHSLSTCWTTFVFMSMLKSRSLTFTLSHSCTLPLLHSRTLTLSHSLIHSLSTCWTTFVFMSRLKSHSLTFTLSHSHTLALSHSFNLSFNHSRHAEQVLFSCLRSKVVVYSRKLIWFFWGHHQPPQHPALLV